MEKDRESLFELKFSKTTYDVLTGNRSFYDFVGTRLYYKINQLFSENDWMKMENKLSENKLNECFTMYAYCEDGSEMETICVVSDISESDVVSFTFADVSHMYLISKQMEEEKEDYAAVLGLSDAVLFTYDVKSDMLECFNVLPKRQKILGVTLTEWHRKVKLVINDADHKSLDNFVFDLNNGVRSFLYTFSGADVFKFDGRKKVSVYGTAIYKNGVHVRSVGMAGKISGAIGQENMRKDQLTGLVNKENITNYAKKCIDEQKAGIAFAIIDLDNFKDVNDNYGHMKGDEVLRKCASIIEKGVEGIGTAGRIGGDEFFIVFEGVKDTEALKSSLRSIKNSVASEYSEAKDGFKVTTSIGCAVYSEAASDFDTLFHLADYMLYRAKDKGKNRYIVYIEEKHGTVEEILSAGIENIGASSRRDMGKSDVCCKILDKVLMGEGFPLDNLLNDIVDYFGVERVVIYDKDETKIIHQCGSEFITPKQMKDTCDYIHDEKLLSKYENGVLVVNNIKKVEQINTEVYNKMVKQGILSFMHHEVTANNGKKYLISYESVINRNTWNVEDMHFFRLFDKVFSCIL